MAFNLFILIIASFDKGLTNEIITCWALFGFLLFIMWLLSSITARDFGCKKSIIFKHRWNYTTKFYKNILPWDKDKPISLDTRVCKNCGKTQVATVPRVCGVRSHSDYFDLTDTIIESCE